MYLSNNIVRPIRKLAAVAKDINPLKRRKIVVPQFSDRKDEINDLAVSLKNMLNSLLERMDAIENFAADVAHEIKNPLTSLKSAVEAATKTKDKKQIEKLSEIIIDDVKRLDRLVTDISNFSRLDAELSREKMKKADVKKIIQDIVNFYNRNNELIFVIFNKELKYKAIGNKQRLSQVFTNIFDNALSFNKRNKKIEVYLKTTKNLIIINIDDFGPGIQNQSKEKIFDRFYTERPKGEKFGEHSGLGLSISKQIIEVHNGSITAENKINKNGKIAGARFTIMLKKIQ